MPFDIRTKAVDYCWATYNVRRVDLVLRAFSENNDKGGGGKEKLMDIEFDQSRILRKAKEGFVSEIPEFDKDKNRKERKGLSRNRWVKR